MRTRPIVFSLLATLSTSASSLPFGTRGANPEEGGAEAVTDAQGSKVEIHFPDNHKNQDRRNHVVEQFFSDKNAYSTALRDEIRNQAGNLTDFLTSTRRTLHKHPELMYQEEQTSRVIQSVLKQLDIPFTTGWAVNTRRDRFEGPGGYGVVADIGTGGDPCVLLRADMDALPIHERTENVDEFKSRIPNKMHACGHDGHTTMLLGAASVLKQMEDSINGTVRLMFQPAEEGGAGGKRMVEEGLINQEPKPQYAFGLHVWPTLPSGSIAARPGPLLAATESFEIVLAGTGGHAAMPHLSHDPIVTASAIVMNLQTIVSRSLSPLESGVVSITKVQAGDAYNIIPAAAVMRGTIRALSTETLIQLRESVKRIVESTAEMYHCNTTITYSPDFYPPTVNDPELYEQFSKDVGALVSEEGFTRDTEPTMGGEDFSFLAERIPSTFFLLGQGSATSPPSNFGLHHPHFALDESIMPRGVELHVNLALRALQRLNEEGKHESLVA